MPTIDRFSKFKSDIKSPASDAAVIIPSDSTVLVPTRSLYIGVTGNLTVKMNGYEPNTNIVVTFSNVPAGAIMPIRVSKVFANTTCQAIVGLY